MKAAALILRIPFLAAPPQRHAVAPAGEPAVPACVAFQEHVIPKRTCRSLAGRPGEVLECRSGVVWVTQDGDCRDCVLGPGERHVVDRPVRVIAYALQDAVVTTAPPQGAASPLR